MPNDQTSNIQHAASNIQHLTSILVTGCAGFIGSNFVPYFLAKYPNTRLINLDLLTYAGNLDNLSEVDEILKHSSSNIQNSPLQNDRYHFVQGDICDRSLIESLFEQYDIRGVIHFAAESHVDNSIKNPSVFVQTNVNGTFTLIDVAYKAWMDGPFKYKEKYLKGMLNDESSIMNEANNPTSNIQHPTFESAPRFHHISTDEVYGTLSDDPSDLFTEETSYAPNSPYSASKAGSDMIVRSYHHTYGMNTVITNCSNNYGPKQHNEKLIPTVIRKALSGENIPVYGDGKNIRDWLYVLDHCKGIDLVYHTGRSGEVYNIGGRNERNNNQIVDRICTLLDEMHPISQNSNFNTQNSSLSSYKSLITFVEDRAGHDRRYAIDATKLETELGWRAEETFDTGIVKTIKWYLKKYEEK